MSATAGPLSGRTVVITRARAQAGGLADGLARAGATVLEAPAIEIADPPDWGPCDRALDRIATYDWIVFTSVNAVERLLARAAARGLDAGLVARSPARHAAIGEATARALADAGLAVDAQPDAAHAEGLVERLGREALAGRRVLVPRALVARGTLPAALAGAGAEVDVAPVYRTVPAPGGAGGSRAALLAGGVDAITFTSGSTVEHFLAALDLDGPALDRALAGVCLASIGPVTSRALAAAGHPATVEARSATMAALVAALVEHFTARGPAPAPGSPKR